MATCGDRYAHLIVTVSGLSPANPYDRVPTTSDYEEWRERARQLTLVVGDFFDALRPIETDAAVWNGLVLRQNAMLEDYEALPSPWTAISFASNIGEAIDVCKQAACMLESLEDRLAELGGESPEVPSAPPPTDKPEDIVDLGLGIGALAVIALFAVMVMRR